MQAEFPCPAGMRADELETLLLCGLFHHYQALVENSSVAACLFWAERCFLSRSRAAIAVELLDCDGDSGRAAKALGESCGWHVLASFRALLKQCRETPVPVESAVEAAQLLWSQCKQRNKLSFRA